MSINLALPQTPSGAGFGIGAPGAQIGYDEADTASGPRVTPVINQYSGFVKVACDARLPNRLIYLYLYSAFAQANYAIKANVTLWQGGYGSKQIGSIPANLGSLPIVGGVSAQSLPCLFTSGGNPVSNSMGLVLSQRYSVMPVSVLLQPLEITAGCDFVSFDIVECFNFSGFLRVFLAVVSMAK